VFLNQPISHPEPPHPGLVNPGHQAEISFDLSKAVGIEKGMRFAIREGGKTIGAGVVTEAA